MAGWPTLETYSSTAGRKEDILDLITNVSPDDTPFLTRLGTSRAYNTLHQWLTDELTNNATGDAILEGDSAKGYLITDKTRYQNYTQISDRVFTITGTEEAVSHYGLDSQYAYQLEKAMKELKIKMEKQLLGSSASAAGAASATARQLQGALRFATSFGSGQSGAASVSALTESIYNNALQTLYTLGATPKTTFVAGYLKRRISAFASNNARYIDMGSSKKLTGVVSIYESDFGVQEIVRDRWVAGMFVSGTQADTGSGLIVDMDKLKIAYLRKPFTNPLAIDGDRKSVQILTEYTLEALAPTQLGYLSAFATA
jgi:hypothetical protein